MHRMQESALFNSPPKPTRTIRLSNTIPLPMIHLPIKPIDDHPNLMDQAFCKISNICQEDREMKGIVEHLGRSEHVVGLDPIAIADAPPQPSLTSMELESEFVDAAIANVSSLPQVVSEVAVMQKDQADEIQKQNRILSNLKATLTHEKDNQTKMKKEIAEEMRQSYLTQSEITKMEENCQQLQEDLDELSTQVETKRNKLKDSEDKLAKDSKVYEEYGTKMARYMAEVANLESSNGIYQQVKEQQEKVDILLEERNVVESDLTEARKIIDGVYEEQLHAEIDATIEEHRRLDFVIKEKGGELREAKMKFAQVQTDTEVLHKRNAAQLTRLKCQLREIQARHRHWNEQAAQLERNIAETKAKIKNDI